MHETFRFVFLSHLLYAICVKISIMNLFKVDRLQIILVAKKYMSTCRNCSSVVFFKELHKQEDY